MVYRLWPLFINPALGRTAPANTVSIPLNKEEWVITILALQSEIPSKNRIVNNHRFISLELGPKSDSLPGTPFVVPIAYRNMFYRHDRAFEPPHMRPCLNCAFRYYCSTSHTRQK